MTQATLKKKIDFFRLQEYWRRRSVRKVSVDGWIESGTVGSGESAVFQIIVKLNLDATVTSISNTATVASSTSNPNPKNNTSTVTFSVIPAACADLQILKIDDPNKVAPNGTITYTLTLTNAGPSAAQNVTVTGAIPAIPLSSRLRGRKICGPRPHPRSAALAT